MEATFDNKANVLNAKLRTTHDDSVIYTISTAQTIWGRTYTYVRDNNPVHGGEPTKVVGVINWRKKTFEIQGHRKAVKDIRRKGDGFRNKSRFWKWADGREEYNIVHREEAWEATCTSTNDIAATFSVPYRPQLFGKTKHVVMNLSRVALLNDEVFLILTFIYCETKRQEKINSAAGW